ncbi:transporter [Lithospermum erythrorhizon]|uniref:Nuclear pore complex protein NUP35 n=1 Tax=Lithospermum erythrorhizon TaxID=34254 RepID=A0AAV3NWM9_LITER
MSSTPKPSRQSLFFQDLATPISSRRSGGGGKFSTPGQAAAVSALWRENFSNSDLPPPPAFTLEDRSDFSPEFGGAMEYSTSPQLASATPFNNGGKEASTPPKNKSEAPGSSFSLMGMQEKQQSPHTPVGTSGWWSASKSGGSAEEVDKGKGSPVEGVVHPGALITLPPPREVARPEMKRSSVSPVGNLDEEEWVTVYGFSPAETNMVLREFEKCGVILKHVPGPREANWMHILYQNRFDAQKALSKNGSQLNGVLIIGVKPVDPMQRQALNEKLNHQGFMPLPPFSSRSLESNSFKASPHSSHLQNGSSNTRAGGTVATPTKSYMSKIVDLMFGV